MRPVVLELLSVSEPIEVFVKTQVLGQPSEFLIPWVWGGSENVLLCQFPGGACAAEHHWIRHMWFPGCLFQPWEMPTYW